MIESLKKALFGENTGSLQKSSEPSKYSTLEDSLGYKFANETLLTHSLRHKSSVRAEEDPNGLTSNERLEFLGDAVIDCLVTAELFNRYQNLPEGKLSKMKSLLVSRKILGIIAGRINLDSFIIKGKSERKNREKRGASSIESNAFEALIGAIYLDSNIDSVKKVLTKLLFPNIDHFVNDSENRNYKSRILELAQSDGLGIPQYPLIAEEGPDHMKKFKVSVEILGVELGIGVGKNKKEAQQEAARIAVKKYGSMKKEILSKLAEKE
jgi:ribonuclease-3